MALSFGFKKKIESKLVASNSEKIDRGNEKDYLTSLEGKELISRSLKNSHEIKELVIPLIKKNVYRNKIVEKDPERKNEATDSLQEEAAKEIILDSKRFLEKSTDSADNFEDLAIPLLLKNKVPEGFETDDKLDVSLRPDEATEAQYNQVPVSAFGMAVLRGMGWAPETGIGKTFQKNTKMLEQKVRPKGLGLGAGALPAQISNTDNKNSSDMSVVNDGIERDTSALAKGANVLVTHGSHKSKYGTILSVDLETDRFIVKMAIGGKTEQIGRNCLKAVSNKEFASNAKDLSRLSKAYTGESIIVIEDNSNAQSVDAYHKKKSQKRKRNQIEGECKRKDLRFEVAHSKSNKPTFSDSQTTPKSIISWVRPQIRVRIIDKKYCQGRYFKEKVTVEDVLGRGKCCCKTDDGKILDGITDSMLETVIPKSSSDAYVIIVRSHKCRHDGKLAKILEKDKDKCEAYLQLIDDRSIVVKVAFEDMCEFTGDPEMNTMF